MSEGEYFGQPDPSLLEGKQGIELRSAAGALLTAITCDGDMASRMSGTTAFNMIPTFYMTYNLARDGIPSGCRALPSAHPQLPTGVEQQQHRNYRHKKGAAAGWCSAFAYSCSCQRHQS